MFINASKTDNYIFYISFNPHTEDRIHYLQDIKINRVDSRLCIFKNEC